MKITILDRYIFKKLFVPFIGGMCGFLIILSIDPMVNSMQYMINNKIAPFMVFKWFIYKLPENILYTFPMSVLLSTLLVFSDLSRNSEITAIKAGGINLYRLMLPTMVFAFIVSLCALLFNEKVTPIAYKRQKVIKEQYILKIPPSRIKENIFLKDSADTLLFVGRAYIDDQELRRIAFIKLKNGLLNEIIFCKRGKKIDGKWIFYTGYVYEYIDGKERFKNTFRKKHLTIEHKLSEMKIENKRPKEMSIKQLRSYIEKLKKNALTKTTPFEVELYLKTAIPFASFIFGFIGIAMGLRPNRGGAFIGFGMSLLVVFIYYVCLSIFRSYGKGELFHPLIAGWFPNIIFCFIGIYFIHKANQQS